MLSAFLPYFPWDNFVSCCEGVVNPKINPDSDSYRCGFISFADSMMRMWRKTYQNLLSVATLLDDYEENKPKSGIFHCNHLGRCIMANSLATHINGLPAPSVTDLLSRVVVIIPSGVCLHDFDHYTDVAINHKISVPSCGSEIEGQGNVFAPPPNYNDCLDCF